MADKNIKVNDIPESNTHTKLSVSQGLDHIRRTNNKYGPKKLKEGEKLDNTSEGQSHQNEKSMYKPDGTLESSYSSSTSYSTSSSSSHHSLHHRSSSIKTCWNMTRQFISYLLLSMALVTMISYVVTESFFWGHTVHWKKHWKKLKQVCDYWGKNESSKGFTYWVPCHSSDTPQYRTANFFYFLFFLSFFLYFLLQHHLSTPII